MYSVLNRWGRLLKGKGIFLDMQCTLCFKRLSRNLPHDKEEESYLIMEVWT